MPTRDELYPEIPVPSDWPIYAELRGERVVLRDAVKKYRYDRVKLGDILVDVPGEGPSYPWRSSAYVITADGKLRL